MKDDHLFSYCVLVLWQRYSLELPVKTQVYNSVAKNYLFFKEQEVNPVILIKAYAIRSF